MSSFGINLDLSVRGQDKFQRAIRTVEQLETAVKRASKELDLSGKLPGRGAEADKIGTLTKRMNDLAKKLVDTGESGKTTQAGISDLTNSFKSLARISDVTKVSFKNFVEATVVAEKEVEKLARAEENARRAFLGMQSLEEREAQLERRANTLRNLRTRKKLKEQEARAREENARAIKREADAAAKLNRQNERDAKLARQRKSKGRGKAIGDLAASVGFPLLFGGGIGSVAGGAIGSIVGSATGIGFGTQILGSALGGGLEQAARAAAEFATTLTSAKTSVDELVGATGARRTGTAASARFAQTLGIGAVGRAGLQNELASIVGDKGVKSLEALADSSAEAANSVSQFGAKVTAGFAPVLTAVNKTIATVLGGEPAVQRLKQKEADLEGLKEAGATGFAIARVEAEIAQLRRDSSEELERQADLEGKIEKVKSGMINLENETLQVERSKLTARRDGLAAAQGNLAVSRIQQELLLVQLELDAGVSEEKEEQLKLQKKILGLQIQTAEAARNNAAELARRQIQKEQMSGATNQIKAIRKEQQLELQYQQGKKGRFALFEEEKELLNATFVSNGLILDIERKKALIGVTEAERISSINRDYDLKVRLLEKEHQLNEQKLVQARAEHRLGRLQVQQALNLQRIQARTNAEQSIRQTSPFARESFLTDPFFGSSRELAANQSANFDDQVSMMGFQLDQNQRQLDQAIADEASQARIQALEDQRAKLELNLEMFEKYQPAVDEAALAQARFSDALAITVPVTDSLFDSLIAVVEGTKTAEQAFADFLRSIASMLMDAAKQMIATYIAIGIARMFAGMPKMSSGETIDITAVDPSTVNSLGGLNFGGYMANGGQTTPGNAYMVGERGPELFVPGAKGNIVPNDAMGGSNIVVNVDASGSSVEGDSDQAAQLGKMLGAAVQAELVKQKRPGGLLAS